MAIRTSSAWRTSSMPPSSCGPPASDPGTKRSGDFSDLARGLVFAAPALMFAGAALALGSWLSWWSTPLALIWGWAFSQFVAYLSFSRRGLGQTSRLGTGLGHPRRVDLLRLPRRRRRRAVGRERLRRLVRRRGLCVHDGGGRTGGARTGAPGRPHALARGRRVDRVCRQGTLAAASGGGPGPGHRQRGGHRARRAAPFARPLVAHGRSFPGRGSLGGPLLCPRPVLRPVRGAFHGAGASPGRGRGVGRRPPPTRSSCHWGRWSGSCVR